MTGARATLSSAEWLYVRKAALQWAEQVHGAEPGPEPLLGEIERILTNRIAQALEAAALRVESVGEDAVGALARVVREPTP